MQDNSKVGQCRARDQIWPVSGLTGLEEISSYVTLILGL